MRRAAEHGFTFRRRSAEHGFTFPRRFAEHGFTSPRRFAEHGFTFSRRSAEHGFTLIEVMVALLIFAMLALAGIGILSFSIRAQAATGAKLDDNAALNRTLSALAADLAQAVGRPVRDERGATLPAFAGEGGSGAAPMLRLVRGGWSDIDGAARPSEQKVAWTLDGHMLRRVVWPQLDGAAPLVAAPMLHRVKAVRLRYRFGGAWSDRWDGAAGVALPQAMEWRIVRDDGTEYRQLLLVGTGYEPGPPRAD